ncbi:hypothetical protein [Aurantivibrio infirmus]
MNNIIKTLVAIVLFSGNLAFAIEKPSHRFKTTEAPAELESIAQAMPDYMNVQELDYFLDMIDVSSLVDEILDQVEGSNLTRSNTSFMKRTLEQQFRGTFFETLKAEYGEGADWSYLRHREFQKQHHLLFRIDYEEGFEYLEMKMSLINDEWRIKNIFTYGTDIWVSEAMAGAMTLLAQASQDPSSNTNSTLMQFVNAANALPARAVFLYDKLSPELQNSEFIQSIYIKSAVSLSDEQYQEVMKNIVDRTKVDEFVLAKMGYYRLSQEHKLTIKYLDLLNKKTGGDLELDLMKAESYLAMGDNKNYSKTLRDAITNHPSNDSTYYTALMLFAQQGHYHEATLVLEILRDEFDTVFDIEILASFAELKDFVDSSVFTTWRQNNY